MRLSCVLWLGAVSLGCGGGAPPAEAPADKAAPRAPAALAPVVEQSSRPCAPAAVATNLDPPLRALLDADRQLHLLTYDELDSHHQKIIDRAEFAATDRGDTNDDGFEDLVAILVRCRDNERTFAVAVFHGGIGDSLTESVWVPENHFQVFRVRALKGAVMTSDCYSCDVFSMFSWSGEAYEDGIRRPHDRICTEAGATIHAAPDAGARVLFTQPARSNGFGGYVEVLQIGDKATGNSRWQKVRLLGWSDDHQASNPPRPITPGIVGFMDSAHFDEEMGCW